MLTQEDIEAIEEDRRKGNYQCTCKPDDYFCLKATRSPVGDEYMGDKCPCPCHRHGKADERDLGRLLASAIEMAHTVHANQRYGDFPYTYHLAKVSAVLTRFNITDLELHAAAWLHDTMEDAGLKMAEVNKCYGLRVSAIVWAVSDGEGASRKERKAKAYSKMAGNRDAIKVKLADRIANVEECIVNNSQLLVMYKQEYPEFRQELRSFWKVAEDMWGHLDKLMALEDETV